MPFVDIVSRIGDMDPQLAIALYRQPDGDVILSVGLAGRMGVLDFEPADNSPILSGREGLETRSSVEFCTSGGRSPHTHRALVALMDAIRKDNEERPISP